MDHFNVTVQKNGTLVSTRRGLQVSKHKYHGISFVNSCGPASGVTTTGDSIGHGTGQKTKATAGTFVSANAPQGQQGDKPLPHRWKFVTKPAVKTKEAKEATATEGDGAVVRRRRTTWTTAGGRRASPATSEDASTTTIQSGRSESSPEAPTPDSSSSSSSRHGTPLAIEVRLLDCEAELVYPNASALQGGKRTRKTRSRGVRTARRSSNGSNGSNGSNSSTKNMASITNIDSCMRNVGRSLPTWKMCRIPQLDEAQQHVFHQYFQLVPRKIYPFEDILQYNPARSSEFYWMVVQDPAAVRCVLLCGAMFRAVLSGAGSSGELASEVANVCGIVNEQLGRWGATGGGRDGGKPATAGALPATTLECITTLALMGGFTGRYDHWHVHMRGLKKMVELSGDNTNTNTTTTTADQSDAFVAAFRALRPSLQTKMRKTDLKGAIALGTMPYLPFARTCTNASDAVLSTSARTELATTVSDLLAPFGAVEMGMNMGMGAGYGYECGLYGYGDYGNGYGCSEDYDEYYDYCGLYSYSSGYHQTHYGYAFSGTVRPAVVDAVGQLCIFVRAVQLASDRAGTADPLPLDPYGFAEELHWLQYQLVCQPGALREVSPGWTSDPLSSSASPSLPDPLPVDAATLQTDNYVRNHQAPLAAPPPVPAAHDSTFGAPVTFLEPALRICGLLYLKEFLPDFPRNLGGYAVLLHLLRCHLRPSLQADGLGLDSISTPAAQLLTHSRARAVLLWVCLAGDAVSRIADANERRSGPDCYDRRVFRARLTELLSSSPTVNTVATDAGPPLQLQLPDSDWALCRLLDLRRIRPGREDDQQALLQILAEEEHPEGMMQPIV